MPFDPEVKTRMFIRCNRFCCLCLKHCGINIEAAHIIDESAGGSNEEDNGIPLCFDCHQEVGSYNDKHPRGNKIRPEELRARRDRVYELLEQGKLYCLQPASLPRLFERRMTLRASGKEIWDPSIADILVAVGRLDGSNWNQAFLILVDCAWDNAYIQACQERTLHYSVEYRDGATQMHYRALGLSIEAVKIMLLSYVRQGDELLRHAAEWQDVTVQVAKAMSNQKD